MERDLAAIQAIFVQAATAISGATNLTVVALSLLVYDYAITLDQEIKFIWNQRWSFGKAVYIFIRYATILTIGMHLVSMFLFRPSILLCRTVEGIFVWSSVVIIIAGSSILIVRTWLLWGGEKWVLVALIGGLLVASGFSIYYVYVDALQAHIISINPPLLPGCIVRISPTVWRILVPPLFYQTFIIALGVTKVLMTPNRAPLAMRLFVGGTMYYIGVTAVLLFTTIGAAYGPTRAPVIGSGFHTACFSVGCSRIVLSLHSWADKNQRHSVARTSKRITYHSPSSSISAPFPGRDSPGRSKESTPPPDIEAGTIGITSSPSGSTTAAPLLQPPAANVRPRLPSIGRPPSPGQVLSETHTLQHQQQRWPPRKSSLYPTRHAFQTSEVTGQLDSTPEYEAKRRTETTLVTQNMYNVI